MFKVGDRVKYKSGTTFSNGAFVNTVDEIDGDQVRLMETGLCVHIEHIEHEPPTTSPVRTVTRREIVPGAYGPIYVLAASKTNVVIRFIDSSVGETTKSIALSSEVLREIASLFNQLAEALEDKP